MQIHYFFCLQQPSCLLLKLEWARCYFQFVKESTLCNNYSNSSSWIQQMSTDCIHRHSEEITGTRKTECCCSDVFSSLNSTFETVSIVNKESIRIFATSILWTCDVNSMKKFISIQTEIDIFRLEKLWWISWIIETRWTCWMILKLRWRNLHSSQITHPLFVRR